MLRGRGLKIFNVLKTREFALSRHGHGVRAVCQAVSVVTVEEFHTASELWLRSLDYLLLW